MNAEEFLNLLKRVVSKHKDQKTAAAALGISQQYLTDLLRGRRAPGWQLLGKLGLRREIRYVKTHIS